MSEHFRQKIDRHKRERNGFKRERDEAMEALAAVLGAIKAAENAGCIDHLDCWDDAEALFHAPIDAAAALCRKHGMLP